MVPLFRQLGTVELHLELINYNPTENSICRDVSTFMQSHVCFHIYNISVKPVTSKDLIYLLMNNINTKGLRSFVSTFNVRTLVSPSISQGTFCH